MLQSFEVASAGTTGETKTPVAARPKIRRIHANSEVPARAEKLFHCNQKGHQARSEMAEASEASLGHKLQVWHLSVFQGLC